LREGASFVLEPLIGRLEANANRSLTAGERIRGTGSRLPVCRARAAPHHPRKEEADDRDQNLADRKVRTNTMRIQAAHGKKHWLDEKNPRHRPVLIG
jgi:hypothetical protein